MVQIRDIYAAAYALATGVLLLKVMPGERVTFCFDNTNGRAQQALAEWYTQRAMVNAQRYAAAYRQARHLIHAH